MSANPAAVVFKSTRDFSLPQKVDLRPLMTPVENQGNLNSCTANAIAGAYEYLIKKHTAKPFDVSRLFIYYNARRRDGSQDEDEGSVIQYGMEGLKKYGACHEQLWPYDEGSVLEKPDGQSYSEAARFKALDMQLVEVEIDHWKKALAEGFPIVFGCVLFSSFDDCVKHGGLVSMPSANEVKRGEHGRHAMLCVGYSDVDNVFIVRNSWGNKWGASGYCYMPYDYLMSKKLNGGDCWILRNAGNLPNPQETWVNDGGSLLTAIGSAAGNFLNSLGKETYDDVEHDFFATDGDGEWAEEDASEDDESGGDDESSWVEDDEDYSEDDASDDDASEDDDTETGDDTGDDAADGSDEEASEEDDVSEEDASEEDAEGDEDASEDEASEDDEEADAGEDGEEGADDEASDEEEEASDDDASDDEEASEDASEDDASEDGDDEEDEDKS